MNRALGLLLVLLGTTALGACSRPAPVAEPLRAVRTMVVGAATVGGSREFAAEIRARTESRLGFQVGGKLTRRLVDAGQTVRAGQLLAELDAQDLQLGQQAAAAALRAAQVQADQAAADRRRFRDLHEQGFISAAELERRDSTLKTAQAQLEQARAQAAAQANQASYSRLLAGASGVVTAVEAEPGGVLAAGTTVLRLAHDGSRDAVFAVPEDAAAALRGLTGKRGAVQVRLWGETSTVPATVREVAAAADPATRTFLVKADMAGAAAQLGRTAVVTIEQPVVAGLIQLPLPALMEQQGRTAVWVVDAATLTVRAQPVVVAGAEGNSALIAQGLSAGQRVVTAGVHVLSAGQKVSLYVEPGARDVPRAASAPSGR